MIALVVPYGPIRFPLLVCARPGRSATRRPRGISLDDVGQLNAEQLEYWGGAGGERWIAQQARRDERLGDFAIAALDKAQAKAGEGAELRDMISVALRTFFAPQPVEGKFRLPAAMWVVSAGVA